MYKKIGGLLLILISVLCYISPILFIITGIDILSSSDDRFKVGGSTIPMGIGIIFFSVYFIYFISGLTKKGWVNFKGIDDLTIVKSKLDAKLKSNKSFQQDNDPPPIKRTPKSN